MTKDIAPQDTPIENLNHTDLIGLLNHLEELLTADHNHARATLMRQSEILNAIFHALVATNLQDAITARFCGDANTDTTARWLGMVLQTQKQCAETLKTASTIEYLESIAAATKTIPPSPQK